MTATLRIVPILALLVCATALPRPGLAGDIAERRVLGFSGDGGVFAFEEFGVQDGSGFPYSNIYVIDTAGDSWRPDTPVRVRIDDETATLADARRRARQQVAPILAEAGLEDRALTLAASPLGEFDADPAALRFGQPFPADATRAIDRRYTARLEQFPAATPGQDCETYIGGKPQGFRLTIETPESGATTVLHADGDVPASRGCPIGYRIDSVVVPDTYPAETAAVILSVFQPGFEGPQRRFLAVTGALPQP